MNTKVYLQMLQDYILAKQPNLGDGDSVLTMLYECYSDSNMMDDGKDLCRNWGHKKGAENRSLKIFIPQPSAYADRRY